MKQKNLNKEFIEPFAKLYANHIIQTETIIKADNISIDFWTKQRDFLIKEEPLKIFNKKHSKWESDLQEINQTLSYLQQNDKICINDLNQLKNN